MTDYKSAEALIPEDFILEQDTKGTAEYAIADYSRKPTRALFYEFRNPALEPTYTVHFQDRKVGDKLYKSMRLVYINTCDPTEWTFVQKVCHGDWEYWNQLQRALNNYILKPKKDSVERWRKEMEVKMRSDALLAIYADSKSGGMSAVSSAKWLAEGRYKLKPTQAQAKAREDVIPQVENNNKESDVYAEDIQRMAQYSIDNATFQ
jgi:hypothetical protein